MVRRRDRLVRNSRRDRLIQTQHSRRFGLTKFRVCGLWAQRVQIARIARRYWKQHTDELVSVFFQPDPMFRHLRSIAQKDQEDTEGWFGE